ncbi:Uncharacterised protein [Mycobacteroides abscessus subsp. abscessus]|nr:Uncharacterised protein [Mycobacteroides abscessus subsp. abscessus]
MPSAILTPLATVRRQGMVPEPRNNCDVGQCAIELPVAAIRASSASWQCTAWARMLRRPNRVAPPLREPGRK